MKVSVVTQISIKASRTEVFKYMKELRYHYLWNPTISHIKPLTTLKAGSTYHTQTYILGKHLKATNKVTKFVEDRELELENKTGLVHYLANFKLSQKDGRTQVTCDITVTSESSAFAFATPVLKTLARRELQSDLQSLKIAVEHELEEF